MYKPQDSLRPKFEIRLQLHNNMDTRFTIISPRKIILLAVVAAVSGGAVPVSVLQSYPSSVEPARIYQNNNGYVQILRYDNDNIGLGNYRYAYEQSDGTKQEQQGEIVNEGREDESIAVSGSFTWIGPNGIRYTVTYKADQNGYQPTIEEGPGAVPPSVVASLLG
ncbi:unnamed protein product [Leptosia nina]|uniref:Uncharacterized protein n=1 Tax=Leptosia nina TaxID=320188 RepID=A0AAV1JWA1_9NEOP